MYASGESLVIESCTGLFGVDSLHKTMLTCYQLEHQEQSSEKNESKYNKNVLNAFENVHRMYDIVVCPQCVNDRYPRYFIIYAINNDFGELFQYLDAVVPI